LGPFAKLKCSGGDGANRNRLQAAFVFCFDREHEGIIQEYDGHYIYC